MPFFKTTHNIFAAPDQDELHNDNWFDTPFLQLPPYKKWDYSRELTIEDIDIWEVIFQKGGGIGAYAAWNPYAEFYMITTGFYNEIETYQGPGVQIKIQKRMKSLGIPFSINKIFVEDDISIFY